MSRRKKHSVKSQTSQPIEWLKHRTGYPSPDEREQIIQLRQRISAELMLLRLGKSSPNDRQFRTLIEKYGTEEVQRAINNFSESLDLSSRVADDARSYRDYRRRFSRFGAGLKYYSPTELEETYDEYFEHIKSARDNAKMDDSLVNELEQKLLIGWREWNDLVPPAIPPRPAEYAVPRPASYPAPINELLEWGENLQRSHQFVDDVEYSHWQKFIPALTRMALDPGLLNGWPSESASWAPWHAIHALGNLQAWESAPALVELARLENDWLSDHLPHIWADMGMEVEPSLWMILEARSYSSKQRGLAAEGLLKMAEDNAATYDRVIPGFEKILMDAMHFDLTLNGYLAMFLKDMEISEGTLDILLRAFEADRIDSEIISLEDFEAED